MRDRIEAIYARDSRRVLATLIRLLGDFELAEEALHDAFACAVEQWPREGIPNNPSAWLVSTGRFRAIDQIRRRARFEDVSRQISLETAQKNEEIDDEMLEDDQLRLIFTCCHPSLAPEAQVAMTLREVCGLTTEEIAKAYLTTPSTLAQRIVRAKNKIRDAGIPYEVPGPYQLQERLDEVLKVIYLVFNEGYSASTGEAVTRHQLADEAIRLGRLLMELLPQPEVVGLLALMLLHDARRISRTNEDGDLVPLEKQDRALWNRAQIAEGADLVTRALATRAFGPYTLQAAIAAVHDEAPSAEATDWVQIAGLYEALMQQVHTPVIELNYAVAIAMRDGPQVGLERVDALIEDRHLRNYHLAHAARADFLRRLGRPEEALAAYERALNLAEQEPERRFLQARAEEMAAQLK
ncbi:RNA polymerase sigma factor [Marinobacter nanhaiticus D15-8W]|uniref:RNA polymerase sigma factor n=1 Tax=Marinobacter nanhaiticus D15-8W TaxID=626887 RepID=N6WS50_9GAMM|nr:RNA polymerase sigma factor [Marinobacter nanhaiticus]ENO13857.1 RNA polymerase sigma factor [Marinobacter nanhaiticus D15-8W]BES71233.1 RNA polymerase sigma factor [Marinobacter nanhaiticus D15-8W]